MTIDEAKIKIGELACYARTTGWDDEYTEAVEMAIKALQQEPCDDAISRQAAIVALDDRMSSLENVDMQIAMGFAKGIIHELPPVTLQEPKLIPVSERLPTKEEYIANNGLFIVSDGNRTYAEYFDIYDSMKYFGEPTMSGFRIDRCVIAWMPLPGPYLPDINIGNMSEIPTGAESEE